MVTEYIGADNTPFLVSYFDSEIAEEQICQLFEQQRQEAIRQVVEEAEKELEQLYKQFDKDGDPTEDDDAVTEKIYMISRGRWQALKDKLGSNNQ